MSFPATKESEDKFSVAREDTVTVRCTDDGLVTGNFQITGDYSVTPGFFWAEVPAGKVWKLKRIGFYIKGAGNIVANGYGPITPLTNGVVLQFEAAAAPGVPAIPPFPALLRTNGDFASLNFVRDILDTGAGVNHAVYYFDFEDSTGAPLHMVAGDRVAIRPNDNLAALAEHFVGVSGYALDRL